MNLSTPNNIVESFQKALDLEASTTSKLVFDFSSFPQSVSQNNTDIIKGIIDNLVYANNADPSVGISAGNRKIETKFFENISDSQPTVQRATEEFIVGAKFDGENPTDLAFGPQSIIDELNGSTVDEIIITIDYGNSQPDIFDRLVIDTSLIDNNVLDDIRVEIAPQTVFGNSATFIFPASAIMAGVSPAFSASMTADIFRSAIQFTNEYVMNLDLRSVSATVTPTDLPNGQSFNAQVRTSITVDDSVMPKIVLPEDDSIEGDNSSIAGLWNQITPNSDTVIWIDHGYFPYDQNTIAFDNVTGVIGSAAGDLIIASSQGASDFIAGMQGDDVILGSGDDHLRYDLEFSVSEALRIRNYEDEVSVKTSSWFQKEGLNFVLMM